MGLNYFEINSSALNSLMSVNDQVSLIEDKLKALIELRVSQINGCAYCIDMHSNQARRAGEEQQKLDCLSVWKESLLFTDREIVALSWAESVTNISTASEIEDKLEKLLEHFSEAEAVDLNLIVSLMNFWNRMAISFGDKPRLRKS